MTRLLQVLVLAGFFAISWSPTPARACSCVLQPLETARNTATSVFEGRLERFETIGDVSYAVFRVRRVWKGDPTQSVRVRAAELSMCPPHLEVGQLLIVYALGTPDDLRIEPCSRTAFSANDAAELGTSTSPRAAR